jgi:hypothetical protein
VSLTNCYKWAATHCHDGEDLSVTSRCYYPGASGDSSGHRSLVGPDPFADEEEAFAKLMDLMDQYQSGLLSKTDLLHFLHHHLNQAKKLERQLLG